MTRRGVPAAERDLGARLAALARPLDFAARDDFAHLARVRGLDVAVRHACAALDELALPTDVRALFARLPGEFETRLAAEGAVAAVTWARSALAPLLEPEFGESLLARPATVLRGVGPRRAEALAKRGLRTIGDWLFHLPVDYDDRRSLLPIEALAVGQHATFVAEVLLVDFVAARSHGRPRRILSAVVGDEKATIGLKWFRGAESVARTLAKGQRLLVTGEVRRHRFSKEIVHPEIEHLEDAPEGGAPTSSLRRIVPRYTAPEGVNPRTLRRLIGEAVRQYADCAAGYLPPRLVAERRLPPVPEALRTLHEPDPDAAGEDFAALRARAHERLVLEELYLLEVGLARRRHAQAQRPGIALDVAAPRLDAAVRALPFRLTAAQRRVWSEIRADLGRAAPMHRLLQGDVGSGKTVVALLAALAAAASGRQAAWLAPTELLAEQHERTLAQLGRAAGGVLALRTGLLTASRPAADAERVREALASGALDLVVGTHALLQDDVVFADLALAVVDEQHRFGVRQRAALARRRADGLHPHTLVMTATPIPRTLALTVYGDLDLSVMDERPPGRQPVETVIVREGEGERIVALVRAALARGEQVYVVYPLVEESERVDLRSALESAERIRAAFPEAETGVVHGRQSGAERAAVMDRFVAGAVRILVATTVIEVGVDVPAATLMVVEHAERFGLAQLHQLRGRVGRGERRGTCVLVARGGGEPAEARLRAMLDTSDGFAIADADLAIRGPGEFLGTRQSGHLPDLRLADLVRDARLVSVAREAALASVRADPQLRRAPGLARAVEARFGERLALADVG